MSSASPHSSTLTAIAKVPHEATESADGSGTLTVGSDDILFGGTEFDRGADLDRRDSSRPEGATGSLCTETILVGELSLLC